MQRAKRAAPEFVDGEAQVVDAFAEETEWIRHDLEYVERRSFTLDAVDQYFERILVLPPDRRTPPPGHVLDRTPPLAILSRTGVL